MPYTITSMKGCDIMCISDEVRNALYDKSYTCPLCNETFKSKAIRSGKNQLISVDFDLYAHYSLINPILYDIIVCPSCGYSVLSKTLAPLLPKQKEWLKTQFSRHNPQIIYNEYATTEEAIHKHKIALVACITRKSKMGEQAYLALHISWLYRDLGNTEEEYNFLERAYTGLCEAFSTDSFPILGMDELTYTYLIAAVAYKLNKKDACKQYLSSILTSIGCPPRIKEHALNLKQKLSSPS